MFCLVQYRVRPGEKCEFTTKSTKVTKRILAPAGLFVARQPSRFFSDGGPPRFPNPSRDARCEDIHAGRRPSAGSDHTKPPCLGRFSSFCSICVFVPFVAIPGKDPAATFCKRLKRAKDESAKGFQGVGIDSKAVREGPRRTLRFPTNAHSIIEPFRFLCRSVSACWNPELPPGGLSFKKSCRHAVSGFRGERRSCGWRRWAE